MKAAAPAWLGRMERFVPRFTIIASVVLAVVALGHCRAQADDGYAGAADPIDFARRQGRLLQRTYLSS